MTCMPRMFSAALWGFAVFACSVIHADQHPLLDVTLTVDFSRDLGLNKGSLFEVYDEEGNVVAGAGFLGAYNTESRSNRQRLNFFVKPTRADLESQPMARVNQQTGVYLSDQQGTLYARSRNGTDNRFYAADSEDGTWQVDDSMTGYQVDVAGKPLIVREHAVTYGDTTVLTVGQQTRILEHYYAGGTLVLRLRDSHQSDSSNRLVAIPWTSDQDSADFNLEINPTLALRSESEFVYALGQLAGEVLVATNTGGVYAFKDNVWRVIVEPASHSYQVYSMLNYYDRLLLGHYPSGELYAYDGRNLSRLHGWPPVMPGVSDQAREAQSMAIYAGDLHVGVWPWAEVWRYDRNQSTWYFVRRMFTHPKPTDATRHPYETETAAVSEVRNLWGQRVTSMVPLEDSLFVATSSKTGKELVPEFLKPDEWMDYGLVHRLRLPGQISAELDWAPQPTTIRCVFSRDRMTLWQDGKIKAKQSLNPADFTSTAPDRISWGRGIYGRLTGDLISRVSNLDKAFLGAYVNFRQVFGAELKEQEQKRAINQMLDQFRDSGVRVVMPYITTTSGSANYPSQIVPKRNYRWDPLAYLISEASKRQLHVYPVFCMLACGHSKPEGILKEHPEWAIRSPEGEPLGFISPANPDARDWVTSVVDEVVSAYDVDGVLLDYLRYHNRPTRLDASSEEDFQEYRQSHPEASAADSIQAYREHCLTVLARQISAAARRIRPDLKIAIYSWGPHVASNHLVSQAWPDWSREGLIDMVNISGYCYEENYGAKYLDVFRRRIGDAVRLNRKSSGRADMTFCLGVKTSHGKVSSAADIQDYLANAVNEKVSGVAIFTWSTLSPFLDEVNQAEYLRSFRIQLESGHR